MNRDVSQRKNANLFSADKSTVSQKSGYARECGPYKSPPDFMRKKVLLYIGRVFFVQDLSHNRPTDPLTLATGIPSVSAYILTNFLVRTRGEFLMRVRGKALPPRPLRAGGGAQLRVGR